MTKVNYKQRMKEEGISKLPANSFPGLYPIYYVMNGGFIACADCATVMAADVESHDIHWEGAPMTCEYCNASIESAYGEPEEE